MSFFENTRKPVGFGGKIMVAMMNVGHSAVARWGLQFLNAAPDAKVLDCGCGGGANIKRLLKKCPEGIVKGIDYSPVSVEKSKKVNEAAIAEGRCTVLQGSVPSSTSGPSPPTVLPVRSSLSFLLCFNSENDNQWQFLVVKLSPLVRVVDYK